jgi:hypothetical protein
VTIALDPGSGMSAPPHDRWQERMAQDSWRGGTVETAYEAAASLLRPRSTKIAASQYENVAWLDRPAGAAGSSSPRGNSPGPGPVGCQRGNRLRNRCTCSIPLRSSKVSISAGYAVSSS